MSERKILIASPCYGGQATVQYLNSLVTTVIGLDRDRIPFRLFTPDRESLIPRGRNTCAKMALDDEFTDLFFIDADLGWNYEMFKSVLNSKFDICGGTYPVKSFPVTMNFNAFRADLERAGVTGPMNQDNYMKFVRECADADGEVRVAHVPTGFLRIKVSALRTLIEKDPEHKKIEPYVVMDPVRQQKAVRHDFFKIGVRGQDYLSEDWFFCEHAAYEGFEIALQTKAVCSHTGTHTFAFGQHIAIGQEPLIPDGKCVRL